MDKQVHCLLCFCCIFLPFPASVVTTRPDNVTMSRDLRRGMPLVEASDFFVKDTTLRSVSNERCSVYPVQSHLYQLVADSVQWNTKLIEYTFDVRGYEYNPLAANNTHSYKTHQWSRVITSHGQTILNLAFNYGILSLMTLTFDVEKVDVELVDEPERCVAGLAERDKVKAVLDLALRDMLRNGTYRAVEGQGSVCHRVILASGGRASFVQRCCYVRLDEKGVECYLSHPNNWLKTLDVLLACLILVVFLFGPLVVPDWLYAVSLHNVDYSVILKEYLYKTALVRRRDAGDALPDRGHGSAAATHVLDLRSGRNFARCRRLASELPENKVIPIRIERYDITVNYRKLLQECRVPVGMLQSIFRSIFLCKLSKLEPFHDCCHADILGRCPASTPPPPTSTSTLTSTRHTWLCCCKRFGRVLLVVLAPVFFYVRLALYYLFEQREISDRRRAAASLDLSTDYNYRLMQYLTPTHPVFLAVYVVYTSVGVAVAVFEEPSNHTRFHSAVVDAFHDLKHMRWLSSFAMAIGNLLWPFKEHGLLVGCLIGLFMWPVFVPLSVVICFVYCLPVVFLSCRILRRLFAGSQAVAFRSSFRRFEAEEMLKRLRERRRTARGSCYWSADARRTLVNVSMSFVILATMYSTILMLAEVASYLAEVACFTMMGLIVNASKVLRYGTLIFLVIIYSYDTYNNVNKKYVKLNKALFGEIQRRIKDVEQYTSLPSALQENRGFKSCENSEQDDYETADCVSVEKGIAWDVNDLILFVDRDDTPRIPRKLFEQVCHVPVAGGPGPVYRSLLAATGKFLVIILFLAFVFIVVMSFGDAYKISTTNQTLATLAGGFMPFIFTNLLKPAAPRVETGLVSFRSKLEEIIKNFRQKWPMHDLIFDVGAAPPSDGGQSADDDDDDDADVVRQPTSKAGSEAVADDDDGRKRAPPSRKRESKAERSEKEAKMKRIKSSMIKQHLDIEEMMLGIKEKLEELELEDEGPETKVDLELIVSEQDQEWLMSSSSEGLNWYNTDCVLNIDQQTEH